MNEPTAGTMIGVVHRDPAGETRLLAALRQARPDWITLEVSPYAVEYRRRQGPELLAQLAERTPPNQAEHGEIRAIREMLQIPFEVRAAELYRAECGAEVLLVDDSEVSRELLADVAAELLTAENLRALVRRPDIPLSRTVDSFYRRARRLLADEPVPPALLGFSGERLALLQVRDEKMEQVIRPLLEARRERRWVHVGGVFHLLRVRGLRLLWERFAGRGVERRFLDEFAVDDED
ncbi:MAG: hypothetical protein GX444_02910 [Myxococcales bacterium]|nr:hypothetical protein [Myxococcales bacterium]